MTTTRPRNFASGSLVEFDFDGETFTAEFGMLTTPRKSVPTYLVKIDGKMERIAASSPAGRSMRKAG